MKSLDFFRKSLVGFTVIYALLLGASVELMCRYLFFAFVRHRGPLPGIVEWLMIGQVPPEFFPGDCPYLLLTLFPVLVLMGFFWILRHRREYRPLLFRLLILCNLAVTLIFSVYGCAWLYCLYINVPAPELLDPPVRSSVTAIVLRYLFCAVAAALVIAGVISGRRGKSSN